MIEIINYSPIYGDAIKKLNVEWLQKYFVVEPNDEIQLSDPQKEIIDKGGMIFYAKYKDEIVGTVSLMKVNDSTYELSKMAVTQKHQGLGIGKLLMDHCLQVARQNHIRKLILYSNTKLENAIAIYRKYGFTEIPLEPGHYMRANIKMELLLHD